MDSNDFIMYVLPVLLVIAFFTGVEIGHLITTNNLRNSENYQKCMSIENSTYYENKCFVNGENIWEN